MHFTVTSCHRSLLLSFLLLCPLAAPGQTASVHPPALDPGALATGTTGENSPDTTVAVVEGHPITLSEVGAAARALPDPLGALPFETLYPVLLDRLIDHQSLVIVARRQGLESRLQVRRDIQAATERILEAAYLADAAAASVTEQAIQAVYASQFANQAASEEVRARHILVATEAEARAVLDDLKKGADFITIARVLSKDPDASAGGDLGFFRREQVWSGFANIAFALPPGQVAPSPVRNEFGWHVIKTEEKRLVAPPALSDVHDRIRQELLETAIRRAVDDARGQVVIHRFNLDGSASDNLVLPSPVAQ